MQLLNKFFIRLLIVILIFVIYVFWDNNRIAITEQIINIEGLPEELEGFTILQVSDLHEKRFGINQRRLIRKINKLDYEAIVFTGDMLDSVKTTNYAPFFNLIEEIEDKEHALFVPGNSDPDSYVVDQTVEKSIFTKEMEERGVQLLESIHTIPVDESKIHLVNFNLSIMGDEANRVEGVYQPKYSSNPQFLNYQNQLIKQLAPLEEQRSSDLIVALTHYPAVDKRIDFLKNNSRYEFRDYDLIIAGHYHGGQIRLPFYGALFVPEPWYESSLNPPQDRVSGLWEYKGTKQYVSTGLGSSDAISFLKFRLFNPPEINVLTFTNGE